MSTTRFARLADGREVAFRNFSDPEAPTIVFVPGGTTPVEVLDEDHMFARFMRTLGRYGRLVAFDRPGIGASDAPQVDLVDQIVDACAVAMIVVGEHARLVLDIDRSDDRRPEPENDPDLSVWMLELRLLLQDHNLRKCTVLPALCTRNCRG